jgi:DNA sulfur modification protein DndD
VNNALPLPLTTPSKAIMESMLADQICKVCNTEAKIGSKPYNFMMNRLEALIESSKPSSTETEIKLFPNNYLRKLDYLSEELNENYEKLSSVPTQIKEKLEWNESLKNQIIQIDKEIEERENQKIRNIGKSTVGEETLSKNLKNYTGWQRDLKTVNWEVNSFGGKIENINKDLTEEKLKKDRIQQLGGTNTKKLTQIKDFFQDISKIFTDTKVKMFNEFVADLEKKANEKFKLINKGAFTGVIKIYIKNIGLKPQAEIELLDVNDKAFIPNKSLETSMYISIIMAISDLTKETQDEHYPMLMDAPVSSFGEIKKRELFEKVATNKDIPTSNSHLPYK